MKALLYFEAKWCETCQSTTPLVEQLKKSKMLPVSKVDADYDAGLVEQYKVTKVPTFVVIENGEEVKRHVGALTSEGLNNLING